MGFQHVPKDRLKQLAAENRWRGHVRWGGFSSKQEHTAHRHKMVRLEAFERYGGAKCACCGEATYEFLSLDHINGGGARQRRMTTLPLASWCKRHGWPEGFQVLCHNCNQAKGYYGKCPHQGGTT